MEPNQSRSLSTRDRILDVSLRLFNEVGALNVTTTIAKATEISAGNLYYYFRDKDDIINSIFERFEQEMEATLQQIDAITTNMVVMATYWLPFQFVQYPRQYNDHGRPRGYLHNASYPILSLMAPYLRGQARNTFDQLAQEFAVAKTAQNRPDRRA